MLFVYTDYVYISGSSKSLLDDDFKTKFHALLIVLLALIFYPLAYEIIQMIKGGLGEYFSDFGNYFDLIYIFGSFIMAFVHWGNPYSFASKLLMSVIVTLAIRRTFNFLRIFNALSPIVTMLNNVIWQLRIFLTFYFILVILFSLMYGVLGIGNYKLYGAFRTNFDVNVNKPGLPAELDDGAPGVEYKKIGLFFGNILQTVRISMGDFGVIGAADYLTAEENYLFWFIWLLTAVITCIIFLNFIVAEASASYTEVSEQLENYIQQQRASLVAEAEGLIPLQYKLRHQDDYPKYIVIRKIET